MVSLADCTEYALWTLNCLCCVSLSNTGQWKQAVRIYSSTPLEELHDITGLALAYFRAGLLQDSVSAYERALTMASSEKERAYILTALALLQHRLGSMEAAKTLLFRCSMLKEPIAESLLSLCALGLVHRDATLASAALTELLKQREGREAVEERCLLTCALLALQGNDGTVQREAARAVHSYPGNPTFWALLSRLVPKYYPKKANGGAVAGSVACHSSMTQGKKALLYSGVNQLASGQHWGDDPNRNALKTLQRAALLCPDDPAVWAALMAACHTENTACMLSGSTPCRQGLEGVLMARVSEKVKGVEVQDVPQAQALESWVLQQAVTGLKQAGQHKKAEALCTQVLSVSPEQPAVFLLLRQVQCEALLLSGAGTILPATILDQLSSAVLANHTSVSAWHWLAEVYQTQGLLVQAVMAYRQGLQLASQLRLFSGKLSSLLRLALLALAPCMANVPGSEWKDLILEATTEALKLGPCPMALLLQALLQFSQKLGARETRRLLERIVYASGPGYPETVTSVARWYLLRHLHAKDDLELMDTLMDQARASRDKRLLDLHKRLCS
ncbi:hypothetical protein AAFF_G00024710 [Aldrovandia affinis]|uniref:Tetratricopeptide repeat domain 37 n=1 Tax=Aldrovandia affinis TaxID=143900 RepID=A0AAD7T6M3_9TELE|nr:hypothetical protein AAFF_G00024710 [Aldrovandia affinis]